MLDICLTPLARFVGAWIEGRPENFELWAWSLQKSLGINKAAWQRARAELIKFGYLKVIEVRKPAGKTELGGKRGGTWAGYDYEFKVPASCLTGARFTGPGGAGPGPTGPGESCPITEGVKTELVKTDKQPPRASVVVVDEEKSPGAKTAVISEKAGMQAATELHWPAGLTDADKKAVETHLAGLEDSQKQGLVDELAASIESPLGVNNPVGWVRSMVSKLLAGGLVLEKAAAIAEVRAARARAAKRQAQALSAQAIRTVDRTAGACAPASVSEEVRKIREELRAKYPSPRARLTP